MFDHEKTGQIEASNLNVIMKCLKRDPDDA